MFWEKNIRYIDDEDKYVTIDLVIKSGELGDLIAGHLHENMIFARPLVITGYLCVGMGQTLVSRDLGPFTTAILGYSKITIFYFIHYSNQTQKSFLWFFL